MPLSPVQRSFRALEARQWLILTVCGVLDFPPPDTFTVNALETLEARTVFTVTLAPADLGKVIGKQGRTARAIRTLLQPRSVRDGIHYELDIVGTPAIDPPQPML